MLSCGRAVVLSRKNWKRVGGLQCFRPHESTTAQQHNSTKMIVVIDYKAGNLYNVGNALKYLKADFIFSGDPAVVSRADKVILPGVGSARAAMDSLAAQDLVQVLQRLRVPFLGICLGLQLLFEVSEEDNTQCLGVLPGAVRRFNSSQVKVPHMGWNQVVSVGGSSQPPSSLLQDISEESFFYLCCLSIRPSLCRPTAFSSVTARRGFGSGRLSFVSPAVTRALAVIDEDLPSGLNGGARDKSELGQVRVGPTAMVQKP